MEAKKKKSIDIGTTCGCYVLPAAAGIATNLAGGDTGTAALIGLGIAGALPAIGVTVGAAVGGGINGKKTVLAIAGIGLAGTVFLSGIGAGVSAGSHKITGMIKNNLSMQVLTQQPTDKCLK